MTRHARVIQSRRFRKPGTGLNVVAKHAPARRRAFLDAAPAAQPEVCAFDEAVERGRQLRAALRSHELEGDVIAVDDRVSRAKNAGARVALERVDPALVGRPVHSEAHEDAVVRGSLSLERRIADTHDRHEDSTSCARRRRWSDGLHCVRQRARRVTSEPFARQAQRENAEASAPHPNEGSSPRRSMAYRMVGEENPETTGYGNTGPRVCPEALS